MNHKIKGCTMKYYWSLDKNFLLALLYLTSVIGFGQAGYGSSSITMLHSRPEYFSIYTTANNYYVQNTETSTTQWQVWMKDSFHQSENEVGSWNVTERSVACILLTGSIKLTINYTDVNNHTKLSNVEVPSSAVARGSCNESPTEQRIILSWLQTSNATQSHRLDNNTLTFVFRTNETAKRAIERETKVVIPPGKFAIVKVAAVIYKNEKSFPNATNASDPFMIAQQGLAVFQTSLKHSFACDAIISIGSSNDQLAVLLQNSQIESFRKSPKGRGCVEDGIFSPAEHCSADEISTGHVVMIVIVSVVVLVLIAIAIAAVYHMEYVTNWLGKRRARRAGYVVL